MKFNHLSEVEVPTTNSLDHSPPHINVVVPAYFSNPHRPGLEEGFRNFFAQFSLQRYTHFDIFICDSGPVNHKGLIQHLLEKVLEEEESWLCEKVVYDYTVVEREPLSRAEAMNEGVRRTSGDIVLFLHLDCALPEGGLALLVDAVLDGCQAGGFLKEYVGKTMFSPLQATERYLNWVRTVLSRQVVGTNSIFMTRELALKHPYQGGFLEDVEMSDWLRDNVAKNHFSIVRDYVTVSANKYKKQGEFASIAINAAVMTLYRLFHVQPELLKHQIYYRKFPKNWTFLPTLWSTCKSLIQERDSHL